MEVSFKAGLLNKAQATSNQVIQGKVGSKEPQQNDEFLGSYKVSNSAKGNVALAGVGALLLASVGIFAKNLSKTAKAIMISAGALASLGGIALTLKSDKEKSANIIDEILPDGSRKTCNVKLNSDGSTFEKGRLIKPDGVVEEYVEHKNKDEIPLFVEKNISRPDGKNYHFKVSLVPEGNKITKSIKEITEADGTKIIHEHTYAQSDYVSRDYSLIVDGDSDFVSSNYVKTTVKPDGVQIIEKQETSRNADGAELENRIKTTKYPNGKQDIEQMKRLRGKDDKTTEEKESLFADGKKVKSVTESQTWKNSKTETETVYPNGNIEKRTLVYSEEAGDDETITTKYKDGRTKEEKILRASGSSYPATTKSEAKITHPDNKEEITIKEYEYDDKNNMIKEATNKTLPDGTQIKELVEKSYEYNENEDLIGIVETKTKADGTKETTSTSCNYTYETTKSGLKYPKTKETREVRPDGTVDTERITYEYLPSIKDATEKHQLTPIKSFGEEYCADGKLHKFEESYLTPDGEYCFMPLAETGATTFTDGGVNEYKVKYIDNGHTKVEEGISRFKNGDVKKYKEHYSVDLFFNEEKVKEEYTITHPDGSTETSKKELGAGGEWTEVKQ